MSDDGPKRSPSGQLRAIGVSIEALNITQAEVYQHCLGVIERRRELHRTLHGDAPYVIDATELIALSDEIRGRNLRDIIARGFIRFQSDISRAAPPTDPTR
jgi:hypothetical protein